MAEIDGVSTQGEVDNANQEGTDEKIGAKMEVEEGEKPKTSPTEKEPESTDEKPAPPQTLYNEYATRVAQVMRTYLGGGSVGPTGISVRGASTVGGDCCKAMMEVVRKQHGKWVVTKLETEHNHETEQNLGEEGANSQNQENENAASAPTIGMEFESVEAAKVFYSNYGEKAGFKTRTGSNRRSANSGALTMQRFVCHKGEFKPGTGSNAGRVRRVFRKKSTEADEDGPVARRTRGSRSKAEVIELESSGEDEEETESDEGRAAKGKKGKKGKKKKRVAGSGTGVASGAGGSLLYRLIRVPHNNNEERRRILLKYLNKKRNRGVIGRPGKIVSRQAVADKRKRGSGGKFLSSDVSTTPGKKSGRRSGKKQTETTPIGQVAAVPAYTLMYWPVYSYQGLAGSGTSTTTPSRPRPRSQPRVLTYKENETPEPDPTEEITAEPGGEPKLGMVFENEEKAHDFYSKYAMKIGFTIRKGWWDRAGRSVTKSRSFVCSKEGYRPRSNSSNPKRQPLETRTNCGAHMTIKITVSGKYVVTEFVSHHNHELEPLLMDIQALRKQNLLAKVVRTPRPKEKEKEQAIVVHQEIEKEKEVEAPVYIPDEYKNYVRSKLVTKMPQGDAGVICEYMQKVKGENPNYFYSVQLDETDQVTNVFWADAKSINDYHHFGDVVCFDTRYKVENYGRPLALFIGLNHHRQIVIFGMALMYDESLSSFKWLFETFKSAMSGKQPKTLLTDQGDAISEAISAAWPGTVHRLSVLHIYQNATRELEHVMQGSNNFTVEFARCLNGCDEEAELVSAWDLLLEKYDLKDSEWMKKLYMEKEKWASLYARDVFTADISATLQSDNMTLTLKEYLKSEIEILTCLKQLEQFVEERRFHEQQADYLAGQGVPRGHNNYRLLWQTVNVYTPAVFNLFKLEFDLFVISTAFTCGEVGSVSEHQVTVKERQPVHFVRFDSSDLSSMCTCKRFEATGIPCCHILKIFDIKNIKELPPQYILHRWRKDAKLENLRENHGLGFDDDPRSSLSKRYGSLCRILYRVAARAAENQEGYLFMQNQAAQLIDQVEKVLQARVMDKGVNGNGGALKGMQHILGSGEGTSGETKRKKKSSSKRQNNGVEMSGSGSKRKKARQGISEDHQLAIRAEEPPPPTNEIPAAPARNAPPPFLTPSQLMQAPYVPNPQFGLGSVQGFHGMTQFSQMQDTSAALQQQAFHSTTQMTQAIPPAPDMQSLQFLGNNQQLGHQQLVGANPQMVGNNQQLGHQNTDQGHYTIPVWDFL
ncbi:hypothetical protein LUZ63_002540 [Rhynchospora breviuscula]|uniref:SWIM-type domain-containing protein n=1 Tax=Rhynchospora breviuscula TaxID=2022672 RepID=A0A9Q0HY49_9POAL|nr:hypothetical protein LUZ63_002540 [Rhynchospora breviuscula]